MTGPAHLDPVHVSPANRGVLAIAGEDRHPFLQGLISNDIARVSPTRAIYATLLTPQGKFLHDFFIAAEGDRLLLECEAARMADLTRRLRRHRLRARVTVEPAAGFTVALAHGKGAAAALGLPEDPGAARALDGGGITCIDPRLAALGGRLILPADRAAAILAEAGLAEGPPEGYERLRLSLGVPDGSRDMQVEKATLLESGIDELNGIDWRKGCYMGQELTARTRYRGLVKKRLLPLAIEGETPPPDTAVTLDGREAGRIRSGQGGRAIALLRLDRLREAEASGAPLLCAGRRAVVEHPSWVRFQTGAPAGRPS